MTTTTTTMVVNKNRIVNSYKYIFMYRHLITRFRKHLFVVECAILGRVLGEILGRVLGEILGRVPEEMSLLTDDRDRRTRPRRYSSTSRCGVHRQGGTLLQAQSPFPEHPTKCKYLYSPNCLPQLLFTIPLCSGSLLCSGLWAT